MPVSRVIDVAPERIVRWADGFAARHGKYAVEASDDAVTMRAADGAVTMRAADGAVTMRAADGAVTLRAADGAVAVLAAPFPPVRGDDAGLPLATMAAHAVTPRRIGILLVRLGGYAVGVFDDGELTASKVGSRLVHGRSAAGGWSQQRFARRREGQARVALAAASDAAAAILLPVVEALDAVVTGGDRRALRDVLDDPRLARLSRIVVSRVLDVPDPKAAVLRASHASAIAIRVTISEP